jgi:hypothetical protein
VQKCSTRNDKQFLYRKFSFSLHEKVIFYFLDGKNDFFCEATTKVHHDNWINPMSKNNRTYYMQNGPISCNGKLV